MMWISAVGCGTGTDTIGDEDSCGDASPPDTMAGDESGAIYALCCNGQVRLLCEVSKQTEHGMVANDSERLCDPRVCSERLLINE